MKFALTKLRCFAADDLGATAIEYALIASLLSIVIIGSLVAINDSLVDVYETIQDFIIPALEGTAPPDQG